MNDLSMPRIGTQARRTELIPTTPMARSASSRLIPEAILCGSAQPAEWFSRSNERQTTPLPDWGSRVLQGVRRIWPWGAGLANEGNASASVGESITASCPQAEVELSSRKRSRQPVRQHRLLTAVQSSNVQKARQYLMKHPNDVNYRFDDQWTALNMAADHGDTPMVQMLLAAGADPKLANAWQATPLWVSAFNGNEAAVRLLLEQPVDLDAVDHYGTTALYAAAQNGHLSVVRALLEAGASVDKTDMSKGYTPLYVATQMGHAEIMKRLLRYGAQVNAQTADQATPLYIAAQKGFLTGVNVLLAHQAQVDLGRAVESKAWTPLMAAVMNGRAPVVERLIQAGAHIPVEAEESSEDPSATQFPVPSSIPASIPWSGMFPNPAELEHLEIWELLMDRLQRTKSTQVEAHPFRLAQWRATV